MLQEIVRVEDEECTEDQIITLINKKIKDPIAAETGMVSIHAQKILVVTPHFTADAPLSAPAPIMEPVIV